MTEFSCIMPVYNKENTVERALRSALSLLPRHDLELIVVNDGSTDDSLRRIQAILPPSPRVKLLNQNNRGVSRARNRGAAEASGQYLLFLDADDEWTSRHIEEIETLVADYGTRAAFFATAEVDARGGRVSYPSYRFCPSEPGLVPSYFKAAALGRSPVSCSTGGLSRHVFRSLGGFPENETHGEDNAFWARVALHERLAWSPVVGAVRHWDAENRSILTRDRERPWVFFEEAREIARDGRLPPAERSYFELYLLRKSLGEAREALKKRRFARALTYIYRSSTWAARAGVQGGRRLRARVSLHSSSAGSGVR